MPNRELEQLITDHFAGDTSASEALADLLARDPTARQQVALHITMHRTLTQLAAKSIDVQQVMRALPRPSAVTMPSRVLHQIASYESQKLWRRILPIASAAFFVLTTLGLLLSHFSAPVVTPVIAELQRDRAILRASPHAQWPNQQMPVNPLTGRVTSDHIDLCAGIAEVELPSGAILVLQGPTVIDLTGSNHARLLIGRLTAYVPPRAVGFTLQAEGVQVVDLGTSFGIGQDGGGIAELHVFSGTVQVSARIDGIETTRELHANDAVHIDPRGARWSTVPCDPSRFIHGLRTRGLSLDLADLTAGGDGFGTAAADGIDPLTGELATGPAGGLNHDELQTYHPARRHAAIDGVFIPDGGGGISTVDSAGHRFIFPDTDGRCYDFIRRGGTYDVQQFGGVLDRSGIPPIFGAIDYRSPGHNALGMHANVGMTIDLQKVAYRHPGLRVERFAAALANIGRKGGSLGLADMWVLIDGKLVTHYPNITANSPPITIDIHMAVDQRYLTLVTTDSGNSNGLDWITLGDPRLYLVEAR